MRNRYQIDTMLPLQLNTDNQLSVWNQSHHKIVNKCWYRKKIVNKCWYRKTTQEPDKEELTNCFCTHTRTAQTEDLSLLSVNRKSASSLEYGAELAGVEDVTCVNCFFHEAAQS